MKGVQPSYLQRLMRHADIKTTNEYYIDLRIHDLDGAVNQLPVPQVTAVEQRATGTDGQGFDCSQNCSQTVHETVQSGANTREVHGRNKAPNENINPAKMRGYAGQCDALPKAGEAIRTPDIHVGNVQAHPHSESESSIIGDIGKGVPETDPSSLQDEVLDQLNANWSTLPEHIKLAIQALVNAGGG